MPETTITRDGIEVTTASVTVGDILPNDTAAAARMVGVGGRFRADNAGSDEWEVMRLPGTDDTYPDNAIVRLVDRGDETGFPIVAHIYGATGLTVTQVPVRTVRTTDGRDISRPVDTAICGNCLEPGTFADHLPTMACPSRPSLTFRQYGTDDELARIEVGTTTERPVRFCSICDSNGIDSADCPDLPQNRGTTGGRHNGAESTGEPPAPVAAPQTPPTIIPRTMADAEARIGALENLSQWLPAERRHWSSAHAGITAHHCQLATRWASAASRARYRRQPSAR